MEPAEVVFVIVVFIVGFVGGLRQGRVEATPRYEHAPHLADLDAKTLRELKPSEQDAIRETSSAIAVAAGRLGEIQARLNYDNSSYSNVSGGVHRGSPPTPVERSLEGAWVGLHLAQSFLQLPPSTPSEPPPDGERWSQ